MALRPMVTQCEWCRRWKWYDAPEDPVDVGNPWRDADYSPVPPYVMAEIYPVSQGMCEECAERIEREEG